MKPLTFQFKERPAGENFDYSLIEYDERLNLSVNKVTKQPAINEVRMETETFTRSGEGADSDVNGIGLLMATETATKSGEGVDSDEGRFAAMMETSTTTFVDAEGADSDKNN